MRKGKLASWAVVALALMASAAPAPQITPLRELHVPFEEVRRILAGSPNAVLLPRAQYDELRAEALTRSRGSHALQSAVLGSADCKVELRGRVAFFAATLEITVLEGGVHAVPVRADGIDLLAVTIGGEAAPLWREGGRLHVLVSGKGEHQVSVAGLLPVKTDSARQILSFSLPEATATRLHMVAPGDVEVKNETAVLRHAFIEKADHTELELVPKRGPMTVILSRNHRQRQTDAIMDVRSVQFAAVHEDGETLRANVSLHIPHGSVGSLRLALPARLAVTAVEGADVAQWGAADGVLQVSFRGDLTGRTSVAITGLRMGSPLGEWSFPVVRPLDAMAHAAVLGVLLEDRLESRDMVSRALMHIRPERLGNRVPGQLDASVRLVALHYAPQAEFGLSGRIVKPEATYRIGANHLLAVADTGLSLTSSFVISPEYERVFSVDVLLPAVWQAEGVRSGGRAIPFESTVADGTNRVRVSLPKGARLGEDTPFTVVSRLVPQEWVGEWAQRALPFPSVRVAGAREETGALAVVGADDFEVEAGEVRGLTALDQQERAKYGLQSLEGGVAFRYEKPGYGLQTTVVRRKPRTTGETLSFFVVGEESLRCHYELSYAVTKARLQEMEFSLPSWTPSALLVGGLRGTMVKEYSSVEQDGERRWTVRLASPAAGVVRLGVDFQTVLAMGAEAELPMPVLAGVAYQTGRVAVEGEAGLDVRVTAHPRPVDIGELASPSYRLGPRLLGSFGFVGTPEPVRVSIARHDGYGLPPVLVEHMQMTSVFGTSGRGQHAAQYRLRSKLRLLEVVLPEEAELWSVLADGVPLTPLKGDGRLLFELPAESSGQSRSLLVVYETAVGRLGLRGRLEAFAPSLVLRGGGGVAMAVPAADLRWVVHLPANYRLSGTSGTVAATQPELVMPAALRVGGTLYQSAGGVSFDRGILGGLFLTTLSKARRKARESGDMAARGDTLLAEESAKEDTAPIGGGMFDGDEDMGAGMGGAPGEKRKRRSQFDDDSIDDESESGEGMMGAEGG
ncbi:MAG: hypothetical protein HN380_12550, partial [Victivallales bacterium]|nr:hypothetical protein [Victivallales bacterium]